MRSLMTRRNLNLVNACLATLLVFMLAKIVLGVSSNDPALPPDGGDEFPGIKPAVKVQPRDPGDFNRIISNNLFISKLPQSPEPPLPSLPDPTRSLELKGTALGSGGRVAFLCESTQREPGTGGPLTHEVETGGTILVSHPQGAYGLVVTSVGKDRVEFKIAKWENHDLGRYSPAELEFHLETWEKPNLPHKRPE